MAFKLNVFSILKRRIQDSQDPLELALMAAELRDFAERAELRAADLSDPDRFIMKPASKRVQ